MEYIIEHIHAESVLWNIMILVILILVLRSFVPAPFCLAIICFALFRLARFCNSALFFCALMTAHLCRRSFVLRAYVGEPLENMKKDGIFQIALVQWTVNILK